MSAKRTKRQTAILKRNLFLGVVSLVIIAIIGLIIFTVYSLFLKKDNDTSSKGNSSVISSESTPSKEVKESEITVINTGDIMCHSTQLDGALINGEYNFSDFFKNISPYLKASDLAIANLEATFGGTESGKYSGYPAFNTPDSLADVIKDAGFSLLVTSNNHSYDTGLFGLKRTVQVLKQKNIEYTGTRETADESKYLVKDVKGIKLGIADFTYRTKPGEKQLQNRKYLNGNIIAEEAEPLINSFAYEKLDSFYADAAEMIAGMKKDGAEFIVFYMHWGTEYQLSASSWQKDIAQNLSNLGVNLIFGSHPHVIEPIDLITSEDGNTETVCVYSAGNAISNQRQELMTKDCSTGHTEDGMLFSYTIKKSKDGSVALTGLNLIPTWVNKYKGGSGYLYSIIPLENTTDLATKFSLDSVAASKAAKSYERTKATVKDGLNKCQTSIGCNLTFSD